MNITLRLFAASLLVLPVAVTAQELTATPSAADSGTIAYVRIKANRIGINTDTLDTIPPRIASDSTESGVHVVDHIRHAVIGGFWGLVGGAAIGAGIGAVADPRTDDVFIPPTALGAILGGAGGLVIGLVVGAAWPVK